jgi:KUP system potassium uptake protein
MNRRHSTPYATAAAGTGPGGGMTDPPPTGAHAQGGNRAAALTLGALGVVYGDIGTSPLYALRECFVGAHAVAPTQSNVLGVLSLIFTSLIVVVTIKYLVFVMRADNQGEGGILALMALALTHAGQPRVRATIIALGIFGATLLYGDGMITPAISVLSAVEGLEIISPVFGKAILPITLVILVVLFAVQYRGTATVGAVFGPFMVVWFVVLAVLGVVGILRAPAVLAALNPLLGLQFFWANGLHGLGVMGAVFLVVTGGEALYADMGHFGRTPIRQAWFVLVLPGLMLNYLGQGALILSDPTAIQNPFYLLAPSWMLYPLVGLATAATCIASQALISGAFSLTRQAVQMGYFPRMEIVHTSEHERGQIYIPAVNWALLAGVILLVFQFRTSSNLAAAYGIAVTTTMVITTLLAYRVARDFWGWSGPKALAILGAFMVLDLAFFVANLLKVMDGGWLPLVLAVAIYLTMMTWKRGREILGDRQRTMMMALEDLLPTLEGAQRVKGTAVFMTGNPEGVPPALLHNLKHNKVLHERVVILSMATAQDVPTVPGRTRVTVEKLDHGFFKVVARYGFMEQPNVKEVLGRAREHGMETNMMDTTFFLGRETLVVSSKHMAAWRAGMFGWMSRNARSATAFFDIPPNRVVEMGAHIEL